MYFFFLETRKAEHIRLWRIHFVKFPNCRKENGFRLKIGGGGREGLGAKRTRGVVTGVYNVHHSL